MWLCFSIVVSRNRSGGSGSRSGSGKGTELIDEGLCKFIVSEVTRGLMRPVDVWVDQGVYHGADGGSTSYLQS